MLLQRPPSYVVSDDDAGAFIKGVQERYEQAESEYREALRLRTGDPMLHRNLGEALLAGQCPG